MACAFETECIINIRQYQTKIIICLKRRSKKSFLFVGKKENISAKELKLERCFDGIIYNLTIHGLIIG